MTSRRNGSGASRAIRLSQNRPKGKPIIARLRWPRWRPPRLFRSTRRIQRTLDHIIATYRKRADAEGSSFIGQLLEARDEEPGEPLSHEAVRNEAIVIFMAGHETTANTLAFAWFLISQAPDVEARLHQKLERVLGDRPPTWRTACWRCCARVDASC